MQNLRLAYKSWASSVNTRTDLQPNKSPPTPRVHPLAVSMRLDTKLTAPRPLKVSQFLTCVDAVFKDLMSQSLSELKNLTSVCSTHRIGLLM